MTPYLEFLFLFLWIPLLVLLALHHRFLWSYRKTMGLGILATLVCGAPWDMLSVITGLWRYDVSPTTGVWISVLPLEECLFTLTFPILMFSLILLGRRFARRHLDVR